LKRVSINLIASQEVSRSADRLIEKSTKVWPQKAKQQKYRELFKNNREIQVLGPNRGTDCNWAP